MIDLAFVREHPDKVTEAAKLKGLPANVDAVLALDKKRRDLQVQFDKIRATKNKAGPELAKMEGKAKQTALAKLKEIDKKEEKLKPELAQLEEKLAAALSALPNPPLPE